MRKAIVFVGRKVNAKVVEEVLKKNPGTIPVFVDMGKDAAKGAMVGVKGKVKFFYFKGLNKTTQEWRMNEAAKMFEVVETVTEYKAADIKIAMEAEAKATPVSTAVPTEENRIFDSETRTFVTPQVGDDLELWENELYYKVVKVNKKSIVVQRWEKSEWDGRLLNSLTGKWTIRMNSRGEYSIGGYRLAKCKPCFAK